MKRTMSGHWRVGTRGSALALAQSGLVARKLEEVGLCDRAELVAIQTSGDRIQDRSLADIGGKGLFIKELEEALLEGRVDIAIHSMKDMPGVVDARFALSTILPREDPRDVLIGAAELEAIAPGGVVGTSSTRRAAQVLLHRPDLRVVPLRGNVDTRLRKLADQAEGLHATLLAAAGLARLGRSHVRGSLLSPGVMLPAVGQGILAVECLAERNDLRSALLAVEDADTAAAAAAERAFLSRLGGSCTTPVAAHAELDRGELWLRALICAPDGSRAVRGEVRTPSGEADKAGAGLAERLLEAGGRDILDALSR